MLTAEPTIWVATGAAAVATIAAALAGWQLWVARRHARYSVEQASRADSLSSATKEDAEQAASSAQRAHDQARWAWEQVKLGTNQLEEARREHRASVQVEQWEWAYALSTTARELVDTSHELIRIALDVRVAPHYRRTADRHYRQTCQRWHDTMIKAAARISPSLEVQNQMVTFAHVHQRLHGYVDMLLRAAETDTLSANDNVPRQALALRQELTNAHRQLQRTVSASLTRPEEASDQDGTKQLARTQHNGVPVAQVQS